jgi:hypothetical protein
MRKIILFICIVLGFVHQGWGQNKSIDSLKIGFDKLYGLDVILTNGKKYFPDSNPIASHPFWRNKDSFFGNITISGKTFPNQQLQYESHKQQFVLTYSNLQGQPGQIVLNTTSIDSIRIGNCLFIPNKYPEILQPFVQVIYQGNLTCYTSWYKDLVLHSIGSNAGFEYSKDFSINYLVYKGSVYKIKNKSSFLRVFNRKEKVSIRKYISSNRLMIKHINETDLRQLISFANKL